MARREDLDRLYGLLNELRTRLGDGHLLREAHSRIGLPSRGVYFLFEPGEHRADERTPRVVRVGTHAISMGSRTTLWNRLAQHRGALGGRLPGGGNHRGSIFRLHVGAALLHTRPEEFSSAQPSWGHDNDAGRPTKALEHQLERSVSDYIGSMPFLWVPVDDDPGKSSARGSIERFAIALLSNARKPPIDSPSTEWLGRQAEREAIRESGLWNVNHVYETYDVSAIDSLQAHVRGIELIHAPPV